MKELGVVEMEAITGGLGWDENGNWVDCLQAIRKFFP